MATLVESPGDASRGPRGPHWGPPRTVKRTDSEHEISRAAELLRRGECVAFPTETVYGLGAVATDAKAAARIFSIKGRPRFDPLIVHLASAGDLSTAASAVSERARLLAAALWPGPLTMVLPKRDAIPDIVTAGLPTVALRVPDHAVARALIEATGSPLAAPSANPFGYISPTTAQHVRDQLGEKVAMVVDGGPCRVGIESTIVDLSGERPALLRPGQITRETVEEILGEPLRLGAAGDKPTAPGQLPRHYAPSTRLVLIESVDAVAVGERGRAALLSALPVADRDGFAITRVLSESGDLEEAAAGLFAALRELDRADVSRIYAISIAEDGIGAAIMDRLRRAAAR